jgi:hypothetical protein
MRRSRLRIGLLALLVLLALATAAGWLALYLSQGRFDGAVARSGITGSPFTRNSDFVYNANFGATGDDLWLESVPASFSVNSGASGPWLIGKR